MSMERGGHWVCLDVETMILRWKMRRKKVLVKRSCLLVCVLECKEGSCVEEQPMGMLMRNDLERPVDEVPLRWHRMAKMYQKVA
jgi:hypothetical protein